MIKTKRKKAQSDIPKLQTFTVNAMYKLCKFSQKYACFFTRTHV